MANLKGILDSIRKIMWTDTGLNGDAQRIEQLGWMLFFKIFSDKDKELEILSDDYVSPIPEKLHWDAWAGNDEGITGDELQDFVDNKLFKQLKDIQLVPSEDVKYKRALIIREVFEGNNNYMKSGTNIRKVLNKLNEIDFNTTKDKHAFGELYETILKELQSAGKSGEFYTPRAITEFVTDMINPQLDEKILDPACGTGGYLTAAIEHLKKQANSVEERQSIAKNIIGWEYKPLPYLLATTNLILHDMEVPNITFRDSLDQPLSNYTEKNRVNAILANPPFGGIVANNNENNFPQNFRTKESADLFLILMIHLLKQGGRAGIVLPDGSLAGDGVKQRVRQKLLEDCNLHTIIRLPNSVFKPYATVATNLLFFTKGEPTKEIWYYEHTYREGVKSYSKTNPMLLEELEPIKKWWNNREENENAWKISIDTIIKRDYDLDIKNPNSKIKVQNKSTKEFIEELNYDLSNIHSDLEEIENSLTLINNFETKTIDELCDVFKGSTGIKKAIEGEFPLVTTSMVRGSHIDYQFDTEAVCIPLVSSSGHGHASLKRVHYQSGKFALGSILAAVIPKENSEISAKFLFYYLNNFKDKLLVPLMKGMANVSLSVTKIKGVKIKVPTIEKQEELIYLMQKCEALRETLEKSSVDAENMIITSINEALLGSKLEEK